jgi:hypothetical protein
MHILLHSHNAKLLHTEQIPIHCLFVVQFLQFVLPVTWSHGKKYGITLNQLVSWWSEKPAELAGQKNKVYNQFISGCRAWWGVFFSIVLKLKNCQLKIYVLLFYHLLLDFLLLFYLRLRHIIYILILSQSRLKWID